MSSENLPPDVIKRVVKELKELNSSALEGITLLPCEEDITNIEAVVTGPAGTPYEGGYFKARLILSSDFPRSPPKANFITKIFHPNVSKKGEICVNTLKKDWTEDLGLKHILLTIKCLLIVPNAESSLNEDASRLLLENYEDYCKHAKLFTSIHASKPIIDNNSNSENTTTATTPSTTTATSSPVKKKTETTTSTNTKVQPKKSLKRL
ncbi:hypothetical protein ACTFIV_008809 [Dictyostelium citrinum]